MTLTQDDTAPALPIRAAHRSGRSLDWDGVQPWFQPIVALGDGAVAGLEALARLRRPGGRLVAPGGFVPCIERTGRSAQLAERMLATTLDLLADGTLPVDLPLGISINLPLDLLLDPGTPGWLRAACARHGVAPPCLVVELTESQPVADLARLALAVTALRTEGFAVAIDDAGSDLPGDLRLLALPFSALKLDKDLVRLALRPGPVRDDAARRLAALAAEAARRDLPVIAEGIETEEDWLALRRDGITYGQGFWIARPMPSPALPAWSRAWSGRRPRLP
ncbi:EAL domain-containing protein [Acidisphaera rubrifaciens]|uniref:Response regulator n=1 Tax=Acidisphaera rubrifaciens HS-AP3 TaxID=1231350 RepID=A0A0D6P7U2_9PROT|nr:EAL domain-containing protein [Acidisphaera rubrifaciens]GAN76934.1 response regulator [Acidisphaera rubrifaciens HS-AP3]